MHFAYTDEHEEFRAGIRKMLGKHLPHTELPDVAEAGTVRGTELWTTMAAQLGLQGLLVPESHGGSESGPIELALVLEECGYALLPGPLFATVALAVPLLLESGDKAAQAVYLPAIASGELAATVAFRGVTCRADNSSGSWLLNGQASAVIGADEADCVFVTAETQAGPSLFAIRTDGSGVRREQLVTLDPTRRQATLWFEGAAAELVGQLGTAEQVLDRALIQATAALAAEQVGGAQRCLELASEYAKVRMQFGRAIGSFQAVKHLCADMLMAVETARTAVWYAAWALDQSLPDAITAVRVAKATASESYTFCARSCIQVLGGIGYTWEHPAQLHFKRATSSEQLLGPPSEHFARIAETLIDGFQPMALSGSADHTTSSRNGAPAESPSTEAVASRGA